LYAQAEQARVVLAQSEASYRAAWRQLAAAVGRPDLPQSPLAGTADSAAPVFDPDLVLADLLEHHTEVLTARNSLAQAHANMTLQRRVPIPDLATNQYHQFDNAAQTYQFGVQLGVALPLYDRNQGNLRQADAQIARATENTAAVRNDLTGKFAEAFGRYTANRVAAERYRDHILPNLARAYRALVRRWNVDEPGKVQFNDIVVAQQNLAQALQAYLTALSAQWQAVVDVANIGQLDELFPAPGK
jgi:cobalt-zinc-cadmium efflux system outer membrane protein